MPLIRIVQIFGTSSMQMNNTTLLSGPDYRRRRGG
jgi:hypothetical protein